MKNIRRPAAVPVGDADEQVVADQFAPLLQRLGVNIPVTIVPDMKHADMIAAPGALPAVVRAIFPLAARWSRPGRVTSRLSIARVRMRCY